MYIVVCLSDDNGIMFNKRRQSRDSMIVKNLKDLAGEYNIYIYPYSKTVFNDEHFIVSANAMNVAKKGDYVVVEDTNEYVGDIEGYVIYRWNRDYPSDVFFNADLSKCNLINREDFEGSSHDKITREVWKIEKR